MSEDQFTKLYKYMQERFDSTDIEIGEVKSMVSGVQSSVDAYAKQVLELTQEHLMLGRKVDRIEQWVQQLAQQADIKLQY